MITDGQKWHYLVFIKSSALIRGVTSKDNVDFYCLNCLYCFRHEIKRDFHEKVCKNHSYIL